MRNDDWFRINHEKDCFELTDAAPQRAVESFQQYLINNDKQAMASAYKSQIAKYGVPISHEQYDELRQYAKDHSIRLSGFRSFVGEISVIKTIIDDINEIATDFPQYLMSEPALYLNLIME